ncbi:MAG TPA: hypothetical protein PLY73_15915, partial [Candidatus Ozemobacteraceae bacterium]|nr:hypothetical protein [Candidatus Ozemobacteraceae bacterium]
VPAVILLIGMIDRLSNYQVPMRTASWGHALFGALAFVLFAMKFLARRNVLVSPKRMNPIGYALAVLFPMAAAGMILPYLQAARAWQSLTPGEVVERPDQAAFNRECISCHDRETAVDGLGRRKIPRWIEIVEPMAWAGARGREDTRAALAAILATAVVSVTPAAGASEPAAMTVSRADAIDLYCIGCHDRERTLGGASRSREAWERIVLRMQKYTVGRSDVASIPDTAMADILSAISSAGLVASPSSSSEKK